jgi:hypothetical protein
MVCMPSSCHCAMRQAIDPSYAAVSALLFACFAAGQGGLVDHGVHAFIVPLRDEAGRCLPGVEIHDCGYKVGAVRAGCNSIAS